MPNSNARAEISLISFNVSSGEILRKIGGVFVKYLFVLSTFCNSFFKELCFCKFLRFFVFGEDILIVA